MKCRALPLRSLTDDKLIEFRTGVQVPPTSLAKTFRFFSPPVHSRLGEVAEVPCLPMDWTHLCLFIVSDPDVD
jgi:hypothetical protein